jgi:GNAT superfamily N-acetyltransferase
MIRRAGLSDVDAIAELYERSFATLTFLPVLHSLDEHRLWFAGRMTDQEIWVYDDGEVRGFAAIGDDVLDHLYVDPEWIGCGIGRALLEHTKRRRPDGFTLWCFQANERARRFYEKHGCAAVEFTDGAGNEEKTPDMKYAWRSPPGAASRA